MPVLSVRESQLLIVIVITICSYKVIPLKWIAANRCKFCMTHPLRDLKVAMILMCLNDFTSKCHFSYLLKLFKYYK